MKSGKDNKAPTPRPKNKEHRLEPYYPYYLDAIRKYKKEVITHRELIDLFKEKFGDNAKTQIIIHNKTLNWIEGE